MRKEAFLTAEEIYELAANYKDMPVHELVKQPGWKNVVLSNSIVNSGLDDNTIRYLRRFAEYGTEYGGDYLIECGYNDNTSVKYYCYPDCDACNKRVLKAWLDSNRNNVFNRIVRYLKKQGLKGILRGNKSKWACFPVMKFDGANIREAAHVLCCEGFVPFKGKQLTKMLSSVISEFNKTSFLEDLNALGCFKMTLKRIELWTTADGKQYIKTAFQYSVPISLPARVFSAYLSEVTDSNVEKLYSTLDSLTILYHKRKAMNTIQLSFELQSGGPAYGFRLSSEGYVIDGNWEWLQKTDIKKKRTYDEL